MKRCLLLALLLVGCKKADSGPPCGKLVDHMLEVTKQSMPGHDMQDMGGDRKAMIDQCEKRNMPRDMRNCLMAAKSLAELGECQAKGKAATPPTTPPTTPPATPPVPAQVPATPASPAPAPTAPAPAPSGSGG